MTNCLNCAAPLHGNRCEYCGTEYSGENAIAIMQREDSAEVVLAFDGHKIRCYISSVEIQDCGFAARDIQGRLHRMTNYKHRFVLEEV